MSVTKEQFITDLNKALEWEYASAIQYVQHSAVITGAQYASIAKELVIHANEEIAHAVLVATVISDLGGVPTIEVEAREVDVNSETMLQQDLKGEEIAIALYKELVRDAEELGEYGIRQTLEGILMQEEEHRRDIMTSLGR
ncbi:MAG: ferritin-like domain-containing protein [Candidatus Moranbacteria bacterium]|jgi:bacterioferritin|nr:ferritin-like domain-containing protein [Candidatus Moranbacteria bacterium]MBP9801611.1 ferritin-like domain-containing protein [Candidatus Moranbacteria bacterium]